MQFVKESNLFFFSSSAVAIFNSSLGFFFLSGSWWAKPKSEVGQSNNFQ